MKQVVRFLAHLWAFLTLAAKGQPYPEGIRRIPHKLTACHVSSWCCHYGIVFFSPFVSPGLPLLLQAPHESSRTHTNLPLSSGFNLTVKTLVSRKHATNLSAFSPTSVRNSRGLGCRSSGSQAAVSALLWCCCLLFFLLRCSSVFTNGTVMWGFRARSCSPEGRKFRLGLRASRLHCALFFPIYCSGTVHPTLSWQLPRSLVDHQWIGTLPAHLP